MQIIIYLLNTQLMQHNNTIITRMQRSINIFDTDYRA